MPENAKETLTTDHVKNLILSLAELNKLEAECKKEGESSDEYKTLLQQIKACGDLKAKIEICKAGIANMLLTDPAYGNIRKNLTDLVNAAKKALNAIKAFQKKPWVVTCNADVMKMAKSKSCAALPRVMSDIKTHGVDAGGLRPIKGNVYDVHCSTAGNFRWVGVADPDKKKFEFKGAYDHPKSGGKKLVGGAAVNGY